MKNDYYYTANSNSNNYDSFNIMFYFTETMSEFNKKEVDIIYKNLVSLCSDVHIKRISQEDINLLTK